MSGLLLALIALPTLAEPVMLPFSPTAALAAARPAQFAQPIVHIADSRSAGAWNAAGAHMVWRYSVRAPGARTMSLSANEVQLPAGSELRIGGQRHDQSDIAAGVLWSRPVAGELLDIEARVPKASSESFRMVITAIQAGFRSSGLIPALTAKAASDIQNYECKKSAANEKQGRAVVGVLVADSFSCTGTLINNTRRDRAPLILTAAHCGGAAAGNDASAASARIYYNESTPCGTPPGEWGGALSTLGASSLGAKDDVWLIRASSEAPAAANPYWVGWDATDAEVGPGTFGIHHAGAKDKQYVASSQPLRKADNVLVIGTLANPVTTNVWEFAPTEGDLAPGASGSSLLNPQGRTVGTLSGTATSGCGASNNGAYCAHYQRLAHSFSALQAALDPDNSGFKTVSGFPNEPPELQLSSNKTAVKPGENIILSWNSTRTFSCNAGGDWVGAKDLQGSETLTLQKLGNNVFALECNGDEGKVTQSVTVAVANAASPPPPPPPPDNNPAPATGGGGGAFGLALLAPLALLRRRTLARAGPGERQFCSIYHRFFSTGDRTMHSRPCRSERNTRARFLLPLLRKLRCADLNVLMP